MGMNREAVPTCKTFVRSIVVLSWLCIVCIKSMKPLSFDSPPETDGIRRFPTPAKVFCVHLDIYIYMYIYIYIYIYIFVCVCVCMYA